MTWSRPGGVAVSAPPARDQNAVLSYPPLSASGPLWAKLVPTVFAARQFISHGHIKVNGRRVTIASYRVKVGDLVEVKEKSKQIALVLESVGLPERDVPDYIEADHSKMTAKLIRIPQLGDVPYPVQMEPHLVVEFYSR